jgi:hypothetical protein
MQAFIREVLADGPEGLWPLEETVIRDLSTNGRTGTLSGATYTTPGAFGGVACRFMTGSGRVTVADNNVWSSTAHSVGCCFRMPAVPSASTGILVAKNAGFVAQQEWDLGINTSGTIRHQIRRTDQTNFATRSYFVAELPWIDNRWHLVVATYAGGAVHPLLYLDGVSVTGTTSGNQTSRAGNTSAVLSFGNNGTGSGGNQAIDGYIACPFYFSSVISPERIATYWDALVRGAVSY